MRKDFEIIINMDNLETSNLWNEYRKFLRKSEINEMQYILDDTLYELYKWYENLPTSSPVVKWLEMKINTLEFWIDELAEMEEENEKDNY